MKPTLNRHTAYVNVFSHLDAAAAGVVQWHTGGKPPISRRSSLCNQRSTLTSLFLRRTTKIAPADAVYICIGPNVWGKGDTQEEALKKARKIYGGMSMQEYDIHRVHKDTRVNDMGHWVYPDGVGAPEMVRTRRRVK